MSTPASFYSALHGTAMQRASGDDGGMPAVPALEPADSRYYSLVDRLLQRGRPRSCPADPQRIGRSGLLQLNPYGNALHAKWACEVAAAGRHRTLFHGAPGVGKTMLAERVPGLLHDLDEAVSLANSSPWVADQLETGMIAVNGGRNPTPRFRSAV